MIDLEKLVYSWKKKAGYYLLGNGEGGIPICGIWKITARNIETGEIISKSEKNVITIVGEGMVLNRNV